MVGTSGRLETNRGWLRGWVGDWVTGWWWWWLVLVVVVQVMIMTMAMVIAPPIHAMCGVEEDRYGGSKSALVG